MTDLRFEPDSQEIERRVEALLFAAAGPLSAADIARRLPEGADVGGAIAGLRGRYQGRGVIIAYHQPCTRAEVESVRGVSLSRGTLDLLLEMGFVRLRGRRRTPGRPVTYGTTDRFLEHFGLASLYDLPGVQEMKAAGLLDLSIPVGFEVPDPGRGGEDDNDLLTPGGDDGPEFAQDFVGEDDKLD